MSALVGKGLPETYLFMEVIEPSKPGPEQQALALTQIDGKCSCFKFVVRVRSSPAIPIVLSLLEVNRQHVFLKQLLLCMVSGPCRYVDTIVDMNAWRRNVRRCMQNPFAPSSRSLGSHGPPDFVTTVRALVETALSCAGKDF